jgi:hypothetical protein
MNPWYRGTWLLLTLLALLTVVFPLLDVAGILRSGSRPIMPRHSGRWPARTSPTSGPPASRATSSSWSTARRCNELTFGLFFLVIVLIPFRAGQRWAWWAAWIALIAALGYTLTLRPLRRDHRRVQPGAHGRHSAAADRAGTSLLGRGRG